MSKIYVNVVTGVDRRFSEKIITGMRCAMMSDVDSGIEIRFLHPSNYGAMRSSNEGLMTERMHDALRDSPHILGTIGILATKVGKRLTEHLKNKPPVVFTATGTPVEDGYIESLKDPRNHLTGVELDIPSVTYPAQILLKEVKGIRKILIPYNPREHSGRIKLAADRLKTFFSEHDIDATLLEIDSRNKSDTESKIKESAEGHDTIAFVCGDNTGDMYELLVDFCKEKNIRLVTSYQDSVDRGATVGYGEDIELLGIHFYEHIKRVAEILRKKGLDARELESIPVKVIPSTFKAVVNKLYGKKAGVALMPDVYSNHEGKPEEKPTLSFPKEITYNGNQRMRVLTVGPLELFSREPLMRWLHKLIRKPNDRGLEIEIEPCEYSHVSDTPELGKSIEFKIEDAVARAQKPDAPFGFDAVLVWGSKNLERTRSVFKRMNYKRHIIALIDGNEEGVDDLLGPFQPKAGQESGGITKRFNSELDYTYYPDTGDPDETIFYIEPTDHTAAFSLIHNFYSSPESSSYFSHLFFPIYAPDFQSSLLTTHAKKVGVMMTPYISHNRYEIQKFYKERKSDFTGVYIIDQYMHTGLLEFFAKHVKEQGGALCGESLSLADSQYGGSVGFGRNIKVIGTFLYAFLLSELHDTEKKNKKRGAYGGLYIMSLKQRLGIDCVHYTNHGDLFTPARRALTSSAFLRKDFGKRTEEIHNLLTIGDYKYAARECDKTIYEDED